MKKFTGIILILLIAALNVKGQNQDIFIGLKGNFKKGEWYYKNLAYLPALQSYQRAFDKDSTNDLVKLKIANCYKNLNDSKQAENWYRQGINSSSATPEDKLHFAEALLANKKYEESKKWFQIYRDQKGGDSLGLRKLEGISNLLIYYEDSLNHPSKPVSINNDEANFCPAYYESGLVFVSSTNTNQIIKLENTRDNTPFYDLYFSKFKPDGTLDEPAKFTNEVNNKLNDGPVVFYKNDTRMIFSGNGTVKATSKKIKRLMLFSAEKVNNVWVNVKPLPFNSSKYSVAHPTITSDGKKLYFASDMAGGAGGTDIYVSIWKDSSWSEPVNLGSGVNTSGNELFPFIYKDSLLYFSSDGYGGLGGLDIYKAENKNGKFGDVQNMGYPINSNKDDFGIIYQPNGKSGFYCSNRRNGGNDDDIYSFSVVKIPVSGVAIGKVNGLPVNQVSMKVFKRDKELISKKNLENGKFNFLLDPGKEYQLVASKEGYKTIRTTFVTSADTSIKTEEIKLVFEKSHKAYVKGIVKIDSMTTVPNARIYHQERQTGYIDTISTNETGEFHCEVESDMDHIFFTEKDGLYDTITLKSTKRKGSVLFYLNMRMQNYTTVEMKGSVRDNSSFSVGTPVQIKNTYTGVTETVYTDNEGFFSFKVTSYGIYDITTYSGEKRAQFNGFNLGSFKEDQLELILNKEN